MRARYPLICWVLAAAACGSDDAPPPRPANGDADGDGWPACMAGDPVGSCDCDDSDSGTNPSVEETAAQCENGLDEDCDGADRFCDNDEDGYGSDVDCDDEDAMVNPAAIETCTAPGDEAVDENCNGLVDEDPDCVPDDQDRDGAIACAISPMSGCDCNDCDPGIRPGVAEVCGDGVDQDCNGSDLACDPADVDRDGHVAGPRDCNDSDPLIHQGALERCNSLDDDCDGMADEGCDADTDGDGWAEPIGCEGDAMINPGSTEICDAVDNDCDGVINEVYALPDASFPDGPMGCVSCLAGESADYCAVDLAGDGSLATDPTLSFRNCGGCRAHCTALRSDGCVDGVCQCSATGTECAEDDRCCPSGCEDLTSARNCGGCGRNCNAGGVSLRPSADVCADLDGDGVVAECACGTGSPCLDGEMCCGGTCVAMSDAQNCGACGNSCYRGGDDARQVCARVMPGAYRCQCNSGRSDCNASNADGCETEGATCP